MSAVMRVEHIDFCYVHGYAHHDGEMDSVDTIPSEFFTGINDFGDSTAERCREEKWDVVVLEKGEFKVNADEPSSETEPFFTLKAGDLAYIYTVRGGLIPCKVLAVDEHGTTHVQITANRIGWKRGEKETIRSPHATLVNRNQVGYRKGHPYVTGALAMVTDKGRVMR